MTETTPTPAVAGHDQQEFQTGRLVTIAGGHAVHDTFTAFLPPLLPRFVEKLSLTNTAAGLLSTFLQMPGLLQPVIGHLADRTTLRWLVVLGPAVTATMMSLLGWAPGYGLLALMLVVAGLSVAAFHATAPVAVGYLAGNQLGRGMGFFMVGGELGRTVGPIVVVSALAIMSLKSMIFLAFAGIATSVVLHFRLRDISLRGRGDGEQRHWRPALRAMRGLMALLAGLVALRSMMMMSITIFLPIFLTDEGNSLWLAGVALSIVEAAGIAGALAGGWISDHIGRRAVLVFGHITAPAALLLFLVTDGAVRIALLPVIGFTLLAIPPVFMAMVQERHPETRALANGVFLSISFAIRSLAAVGFGAVGDAFGLTTAMTIAALATFCGLPLIWVLFRAESEPT
ncbi:MAG: MFS transporter [Acidimicrobiia bacterium]|nr:MFS transporter [Acidimicrobiia bacterium]